MDIFESFGIKPILLAAQIVNFLILLWLLNKFLYKPILKILAERKRKVEESQENADRIQKELDQIEKRSNQILAKAQQDADNFLKQSKVSAQKHSEQIIQDANNAAKQIIDKAKISAEQERIQLYNQAKKDITKLLIKLTAAVTGKVLSSREHQQIINKTLQEVEDEKRIYH